MKTKENSPKTGCCSSASCCGSVKSNDIAKRHICIDFLYLDLSVCDRCQGTDNTLDTALDEVAAVLKATGVDVTVTKIHVTSEEQAHRLRFASSPTIRVNGCDIQMEVRESLCESCGDLCGDEVDCRVWVYQGKEYTVPPKAMIIDAVLHEVYGSSKPGGDNNEFVVPDNLKRFFRARQLKS